MSLRWTSYVAPKSPKGWLKNVKNGRFPCIIAFLSFTGLSICAKNGSRRPLLRENLDETDQPPSKSPISNRIAASAVTPSEKSSINANRKSTASFPMNLRWTVYVASKPPKRGKVSKLNNNLAMLKNIFKHSWIRTGSEWLLKFH